MCESDKSSPSGHTPVTGLQVVVLSVQLQVPLHSTPQVFQLHSAENKKKIEMRKNK